MKIVQMADVVRFPSMTTAELRETFLLENLFREGEIETRYVDLDRAVIGAAVPTSCNLDTRNAPELRADYFLERRELGVLNVGGPGVVSVDGASFAMEKLDCLYVGRGNQSVTFASDDPPTPAAFYLLSYPAHATYPTALGKVQGHWNPSILVPRRPATSARSIKRSTWTASAVASSSWASRCSPRIELEHDAPAHPHAPQRGLLLLRRGPIPARAPPDGPRDRDTTPGYA
jgi:5-keto 4-deoxyuronate isomerase